LKTNVGKCGVLLFSNSSVGYNWMWGEHNSLKYQNNNITQEATLAILPLTTRPV